MMDLSRSPRIPRLLATIDALPAANLKTLVGLLLVVEIVTGCMVKILRGTSASISGTVLTLILSAALTVTGYGVWLNNQDSKRAAAAAPCEPEKPQP